MAVESLSSDQENGQRKRPIWLLYSASNYEEPRMSLYQTTREGG